MEKETIKKIFTFLEEEENKDKPFMWKLMNNEPLTDEELFVEGDLDLTETDIESLPDGLNVEDILSLYGCKNIQSLPEGLEVGGHLDLGYSNITSLPKGLKVGGSLSLFDCANITSLPEGLKVGRNLDLGFTKIISLPRGLKVEGFIDLNGTKLTEYTDDELRKMIKPGYIKGRIIKV
jgi:hypothetical protein